MGFDATDLAVDVGFICHAGQRESNGYWKIVNVLAGRAGADQFTELRLEWLFHSIALLGIATA